MESQIILLDTSILIDFYRKKDKSKSALFKISNNYTTFAVSIVTHYEIFIGAAPDQADFWNTFFKTLLIFPFNISTSEHAITTYNELKKTNKIIAVPDLFIAATAIEQKLPLATLNKKHFQRVKNLTLIEHD